MAEAEYCADCKRIIGVGCACGMSFKDKIKTQRLCYAEWSPTEAGKPGGTGYQLR